MQYDPYLSERVKGLKGSAIREIFKILNQPDMISFAGGIPAPECFPHETLAGIARDILLNQGVQALQYGVTEGYGPLREWVTDRMRTKGLLKEGGRGTDHHRGPAGDRPGRQGVTERRGWSGGGGPQLYRGSQRF